MTQKEKQMYEWQVPAWYYDDDAYISWLMSEDEQDNPCDDMPVDVINGEIIYREVR